MAATRMAGRTTDPSPTTVMGPPEPTPPAGAVGGRGSALENPVCVRVRGSGWRAWAVADTPVPPLPKANVVSLVWLTVLATVKDVGRAPHRWHEQGAPGRGAGARADR